MPILKFILWFIVIITFLGADLNNEYGYLAMFLGSAAILSYIYVKEAK